MMKNSLIFQIIKSARPLQSVKNLAIYAALIFSGELYSPGQFIKVTLAVVVFSILTSSVYLFNDILDVASDREHPFKKKRPIASGKLPVPIAFFIAVGGFFVGLVLSAQIAGFLFLSCVGYLILHIAYSVGLKKVPILDVLAIASGFVLRVYAGAFVINAHMNVWFLLTVVSASLFLAVGKRRGEMTLLTQSGVKAHKHRKVLGHYTPQLLDVYTGMFANTTWLSYALFTFLQPPIVPQRAKLVGLLANLPRTLAAQKLLMITVPVAIYGVMRYLQLIYEKGEGESPERVLLTDGPLLASVVLWGTMVVGILYFLT